MKQRNYRIGEETIALIPHAHPIYQTKIIETTGVLYSEKTSRQLLDDACARTGASYEGKRAAISYLLKLKRNVPIPLCTKRNICAIPSKSPSQWDCTWFFYAHVQEVRPKEKQASLLLTNGEELLLDCSQAYTKKQLHRAAHILATFQLSEI